MDEFKGRRQEVCLNSPGLRCGLVDHCLSSGSLGGQSLYRCHPFRRSIWLLQVDHSVLQGADLTNNSPYIGRSLAFETLFSLDSR